MTIAATENRDHVSGAPGTWRTEYRLCCRPGKTILERRRAEFDSQGRANIIRTGGGWDPVEQGGNESEAMDPFYETSYEEARSLHPIHTEHLEHIRRFRQADKVRMEAERTLRDGGPVRDLQRKFEDRYVAELKRAKLFSKAAKGEAPPEKIQAIKLKLRGEYELQLLGAKDEEKRLEAVVRESKDIEKRRFRPRTKVCS